MSAASSSEDMAVISEIHGRITLAMKPHAESSNPPPFSETELLTMALMFSDEPQLVDRFCGWIIDHFLHHRGLARATLIHVLGTDRGFDDDEVPDAVGSAIDFRREVEELFWRFEIPVEKVESEGGTKYSMSRAGGERLLAKIMPHTADSDVLFRFFDLPPELRNSIYEMVFQYPKAGVFPCFRHRSRGPGPLDLALLNRSYDGALNFEAWEAPWWLYIQNTGPYTDGLVRTRPLQEVLAPLQTCQQFHNEAMPVF